MKGSERRELILRELNRTDGPVTGTSLAKQFKVSRQVIVSDIALIRAQGLEIIATADGYMTYRVKEDTYKRVYCVQHPNEAIEDELLLIVDNGGHLLNTIVTHAIYGEIVVNMHISSRRQVTDFLARTRSNDFVPLMSLTHGAHYHTVEADSESVLDEIEAELDKLGYLVRD